MGITVVVCGPISEDVIQLVNRKYKISKLVHGGVRSSEVVCWAMKQHIDVETFPCDYHKFGEKAELVQHLKLLAATGPDLVIIKKDLGILGKYVEAIANDMKLSVLTI